MPTVGNDVKKHTILQYAWHFIGMNDELTLKQEAATAQNALYEQVAELIRKSRDYVRTAVNTAMVYTYYGIGQHIVENEQQGQNRAQYGKAVLKELSKRLTNEFGPGWSVDTLENARKLFLVYSKSEPVVRKSIKELPSGENSAPTVRKSALIAQGTKDPSFVLPWSHYLILMRIDNPAERGFYEIEAYKQQWNKRELRRQVASSLYERLAMSRDKDAVMRMAKEGMTMEKNSDILRDPMVLEFCGLKPDNTYYESDLENALIDKLQPFLLELGKGFLFEARQKRFTFNEKHFFVDLVLYNRLLQCYVLIDLKVDDLTHQDLGQMQMYVNYYDRYVKQDFERPTIGILLCKQKDDALVELTLPEDTNIYAQQYALCLPDKTLLQEKMKEWIGEYEQIQQMP